MKKILCVWLLSLTIYCSAQSFTDPTTGMTFEVPQGFELHEEESGGDPQGGNWWYLFLDSNENTLTIEIDEYDHQKSLSEHFHYALTKEDVDELQEVVYEGMEFKNIEANGIEFTKCKLRILAHSLHFAEPLFFCDYLFVKDHFGLSISLVKKEDGLSANDETDEMMLHLIESIHFNK